MKRLLFEFEEQPLFVLLAVAGPQTQSRNSSANMKQTSCGAGQVQVSMLVLEIADQDYIITRGAARKRELFPVPRPGKTENSIWLEVDQLFSRPTINCLGTDG